MDENYREGGAGQDEFLDKCIARIARGDSEAMRELYDRAAAAVYGLALSILKNQADAEDVLQDCFLKIYGAAPSYKSQGKPMAWIFTITRNLSMQCLREKSKTADIPQEDWEEYIGSNENVTSEDRIVLTELLETLSDDERQIVVMHAVSGMKHKEIAGIMEMPLSTVLSKYKRSLEKLKNKLIVYEEDSHDK